MSEKATLACDKVLINLFQFGVTGYAKDFLSWVKMICVQEDKQIINLDLDLIITTLEKLIGEGLINKTKKDPIEYYPIEKILYQDKSWKHDEYVVLGAFEFSAIQLVRSRLEHFLRVNQVDDEDIMDISIATIEGIENAAKYGDGNKISISTKIIDKKLELLITNIVKEFDLANDIERGKYSVSTTLMRGIMVMQKLFNHLDLEIINETKQARLYAEKSLK